MISSCPKAGGDEARRCWPCCGSRPLYRPSPSRSPTACAPKPNAPPPMSMPCAPAIWPTAQSIARCSTSSGVRITETPTALPNISRAPCRCCSFQFPTGVANVEIIPETAKLNVNQAQPVEIRNLLLLLGVAPATGRCHHRGHSRLASAHARRRLQPVRSTLLDRWFRLFKHGMRLSMRLRNYCWSRE